MIKIMIVSLAVSSLFIHSGGAKDVAPGGDVETYVLAKKARHLPVGTVVVSKSQRSIKDGVVTLMVGERAMKGTMKTTDNKVERMECLAADRYRYTLLEEVSLKRMAMEGKKRPELNKKSEILGKKIILSKKGEEWSGKLEEGDANEQEQEEIDKISKKMNADSDFEIYGEIPRKVGDEWEADGAAVLRSQDMNGTIKVRFDRVEVFEGERCAVLKCEVDLNGSMDDNPDYEANLKGKVLVYRSLKDLVDIKTTLDGRMDLEGVVNPQPNVVMEMKMAGQMVEKTTRKVTRP